MVASDAGLNLGILPVAIAVAAGLSYIVADPGVCGA